MVWKVISANSKIEELDGSEIETTRVGFENGCYRLYFETVSEGEIIVWNRLYNEKNEILSYDE